MDHDLDGYRELEARLRRRQRRIRRFQTVLAIAMCLVVAHFLYLVIPCALEQGFRGLLLVGYPVVLGIIVVSLVRIGEPVEITIGGGGGPDRPSGSP